MNQEQFAQNVFLNALITEQVPVSVYLVSGIKLQGRIQSLDKDAITLEGSVIQMVYKHAISTIMPTHNPLSI